LDVAGDDDVRFPEPGIQRAEVDPGDAGHPLQDGFRLWRSRIMETAVHHGGRTGRGEIGRCRNSRFEVGQAVSRLVVKGGAQRLQHAQAAVVGGAASQADEKAADAVVQGVADAFAEAEGCHEERIPLLRRDHGQPGHRRRLQDGDSGAGRGWMQPLQVVLFMLVCLFMMVLMDRLLMMVGLPGRIWPAAADWDRRCMIDDAVKGAHRRARRAGGRQPDKASAGAGQHRLHRPFAAVGHGKGVHRRLGQLLPNRIGHDAGRFDGAEGAFERIGGDEDAHDFPTLLRSREGQAHYARCMRNKKRGPPSPLAACLCCPF